MRSALPLRGSGLDRPEALASGRDGQHSIRVGGQWRVSSVWIEGADVASGAARNYRGLREFGVTIRKTADIIIGTFCIERRHTLLHDDRDFAPMEEYLGLKVA